MCSLHASRTNQLRTQALAGKDLKDMLVNVGSGGGAAAAPAAAAGGAATASADAPAAAEEKKEEEKEESDEVRLVITRAALALRRWQCLVESCV